MNSRNRNRIRNGINSLIRGLNLILLLEIAKKGFLLLLFLLFINLFFKIEIYLTKILEIIATISNPANDIELRYYYFLIQ